VDPGAGAFPITPGSITLAKHEELTTYRLLYREPGYFSLLQNRAGGVTAEIPTVCSVLYLKSE